ncbi:MAG: OadG family protein [Gammaproteobacteria bacterium]|nr:OadG family protein [Gammaproteobacteria bacterium]
MEATLLEQGITLMLVGMGTVFVFLTVLVVGMTLMSTAAMRLAPAPDTAGVTDEEIAAISAAITQHRKANTK